MIDAAVARFFTQSGIEPCLIVAAVSGGTDSTALLLALADLRDSGFAVEAAHVQHHLRGEESDADEAFVRDLCRELGVASHIGDGTLDPERIRARGIEAAAREVRYARLSEIRIASGARFIATAHQRNDQAETVLMRLVTGSGLAGLRGIHPVRDDGIIRPLLEVRRDEIEAFLRERGVSPRHDRSNDDPRFLRNRVRTIVRDLGAVDRLAAVAAQAREQWPILERAIDEAERACTEMTDDETRFLSWPADPWLRQALLYRHIRRLDDAARDVSARDLARLAGAVDGIRRVSVTKRLELIRRGGTLVLRRRLARMIPFQLDLTPDAPAFIWELGATVRVAPATTPHPPSAPSPLTRGEGYPTTHVARIDNRVAFSPPQPLRGGEKVPKADEGRSREQGTFQLPAGTPAHFTVRNRRPGDRFQPLGMAKPKKLKDFLIDRKIPIEIRDRLPLLLWNGEIVWVAGVEISERFRITGGEADRYEVWLYT